MFTPIRLGCRPVKAEIPVNNFPPWCAMANKSEYGRSYLIDQPEVFASRFKLHENE
jgi:hypothetical protein